MKTFDDSYRSKVFWILVALGVVVAGLMLAPFLPAILWAIVLSILIKPLHDRFSKRMPPNGAAGMATAATLLIVGLPIALIGVALFVQVNGFIRDVSNAAPAGHNGFSVDSIVAELDRNLKPLVERLSPTFSFTEWFNLNRERLTENLTAPLGKALYTTGYTIFTLVVAFLTMFFMLRDGHKLRQPAIELLPFAKEVSERMMERIAATVRAVFIGVVLVATVQGTLAGIAYAVTGVPNAIMWGVATIVLCTIPLLGAPIVYLPMALLLAAQGKPYEAIGLALFGFLVISQIDNVLRPFVIGAKVDLHPMAIFFSLLGGVLLLGPVGIMAGPMLLSVLLVVQDVVRETRKSADAENAADPLPV